MIAETFRVSMLLWSKYKSGYQFCWYAISSLQTAYIGMLLLEMLKIYDSAVVISKWTHMM